MKFPIFIQIYMLEIQADAEALYVILGAGKDAEALCVLFLRLVVSELKIRNLD